MKFYFFAELAGHAVCGVDEIDDTEWDEMDEDERDQFIKDIALSALDWGYHKITDAQFEEFSKTGFLGEAECGFS